MKRRTSLSLITLFLLLVFAVSISAQTPANVQSMQISLWPEFDDPGLLVLIDGQLAEPGETIRIPVPADGNIHAVATGSGDSLMDASWESSIDADGNQVVTFTVPETVFRVEYYTPLPIDGDTRSFDFRFPANYLSVASGQIELLLPPAAGDASSTPELASAGTTQTGALIFQRTFSGGDEIAQNVSYSNPTGALSVAEDARQAPATVTPLAEPLPSATAGDAASVDPLLLGLGIAAIVLIGGGAYGLWRTRQAPEPEPEPSPRRRRPKQRSRQSQGRATANAGAGERGRAAGGGQSGRTGRDQFCRSCGTEFGHDDDFCRKCGTKRR